MLNSVRIPAGVDDAAVRRALLEEDRIEIGGGLGPMKGQTWRIGLMGESSTAANVTRLLAALGRLLPRHGFACDANGRGRRRRARVRWTRHARRILEHRERNRGSVGLDAAGLLVTAVSLRDRLHLATHLDQPIAAAIAVV